MTGYNPPVTNYMNAIILSSSETKTKGLFCSQLSIITSTKLGNNSQKVNFFGDTLLTPTTEAEDIGSAWRIVTPNGEGLPKLVPTV